jgi:uncharacterized membrane protein YccC
VIILVGLIILVAAVVVGVAGVLANGGGGHALTGDFAVFGYHVTGSTGLLFLYGIVLGAVGMLGLSLLLAGARRTARRGRTARRDLKQSRRDTASVSRDNQELVEQQQREHASTARSAEGSDRPVGERGGFHLFRRRSASQQPVGASQGAAPQGDTSQGAAPRGDPR